MLQTSARSRTPDLAQLLSVVPLPERRPGRVVVRVRGEVDTYTEPLLSACLETQIARDAVVELVVDLRGVTFLGAAGIAALVSARDSCRTRGIRFEVRAGDQRPVLRPLELTGLTELVRNDPPDAGRRSGPGGRRPRGRPARRQLHTGRRPASTGR